MFVRSVRRSPLGSRRCRINCGSLERSDVRRADALTKASAKGNAGGEAPLDPRPISLAHVLLSSLTLRRSFSLSPFAVCFSCLRKGLLIIPLGLLKSYLGIICIENLDKRGQKKETDGEMRPRGAGDRWRESKKMGGGGGGKSSRSSFLLQGHPTSSYYTTDIRFT